MTNERAIELLNRISDSQFDGPHGDERREALEMAVRALSGEGDTISRKMAIDAVAKWFHDDVFGIKESDGTATIFKRLRELPSAQPQRILYANMSDAEFEKWLYEHGICNPNIHESIPCDAVPLLIDNAISELPSAQPERKKGKWIITKTERAWNCGEYPIEVTCSNCGYSEDYYMKDNFCPCCGADLRGVSDD